MKTKFLLIVLLTMFTATFATAQGNYNPSEMAERQAKRQATNLKLKDDAEVKFVNLYKAYQMKRMEIMMQSMSANGERIDYSKLTNEEAINKIGEYFTRQQSLMDLDKEYCILFGEFLTPQQIAQLFLQPGNGRGMGNGNNRSRNRGNFGGGQGQGGGNFPGDGGFQGGGNF